MSLEPRRRVVVSGVGAVSPLGHGKRAFWGALLAGVNGVRPVRRFEGGIAPISVAACVPDPESLRPGLRRDPTTPASLFAARALALALADAGLEAVEASRDPLTALYVGTTMGELPVMERALAHPDPSPKDLSPAEVARLFDAAIPLQVCAALGLDADCLVIPTACAAGNDAIAHGYEDIRSSRRDLVLAGGTDALSEAALIGFARMQSLAPERCQPFDRNRRGLVIGEGAGFLVLESLDRARARGARIYAEVLGFGSSCDAHHITQPNVQGLANAITSALQDSGLQPHDVDLISAHGTGTPSNDATECQASRAVFGERAERIPTTSIKSMLGHAMGAASALEAIASVLAIDEGRIPPTINYETPDDACRIDCVPNRSREAPVRIVISNARAFGGQNSVCVFGPCP